MRQCRAQGLSGAPQSYLRLYPRLNKILFINDESADEELASTKEQFRSELPLVTVASSAFHNRVLATYFYNFLETQFY